MSKLPRIRNSKIRVGGTNPFTNFTELNLFGGISIFWKLFSQLSVHTLEEEDLFLLFLNIENNVACTSGVGSTLAEVLLPVGQFLHIPTFLPSSSNPTWSSLSIMQILHVTESTYPYTLVDIYPVTHCIPTHPGKLKYSGVQKCNKILQLVKLLSALKTL